MPFKGTFNPEDLEMLRAVLAQHCRDHGIVNEVERENVAMRLLGLFHGGIANFDDLSKAVANRSREKRQA